MAKPRIKFNRPADPPPSPARAELIAANAEFTSAAERQRTCAAEMETARQAAAEAVRLHAEFQAWFAEAALLGEYDDAERKRRADLVLDARARGEKAGELDAEYRRLCGQVDKLHARRHAAIVAIVREELPALRRNYHRLSQAAMKTEGALLQLKNWAVSQSESELAVDLDNAVRLDADLAKHALLIVPWRAEIERYAAEWWNLPVRLQTDPTATVEGPIDVRG